MKMLKFIACANEMVFDADESEPIRIPYGKWPYGMKTIEMPDGEKRQVFVTQEFARTSAEKVAEAVASSIAAGGLGMPIYEGHPDVPELAHKYPNKAAIGWVKEVAVGDDAARCRVEWLKFPGKGFGWFSPYFFGKPEINGDTALVAVDRISSIGLTNDPNVLEFRLANEAMNTDNNNSGTAAPKKDTIMEKAKLCELLGLDLESTEEQIAAEIIKIKTAATDSTTQIEAANAEAEDAKKKEEEKEEAFANERKSRIALILDNAIAGGNITPAMRPAWKKKLEANIVTGALALANEQTIKTKSVSAGLSPERTANTSGILALANEKMGACKGLTFEAAWAQVKKERPDLFGPQ